MRNANIAFTHHSCACSVRHQSCCIHTMLMINPHCGCTLLVKEPDVGENTTVFQLQ